VAAAKGSVTCTETESMLNILDTSANYTVVVCTVADY